MIPALYDTGEWLVCTAICIACAIVLIGAMLVVMILGWGGHTFRRHEDREGPHA